MKAKDTFPHAHFAIVKFWGPIFELHACYEIRHSTILKVVTIRAVVRHGSMLNLNRLSSQEALDSV